MDTVEASALETLPTRNNQSGPAAPGTEPGSWVRTTYRTWCASALGTEWLTRTPGWAVRVWEAPSSCRCSAGQD